MTSRVRPELKFDSIDDVIADVRRLQLGGYEQLGNWSLPMICWHVGKIMEPTLKSPTNRSATPEQSARWTGFLNAIRVPGGASQFPAGKNEPGHDLTDAEIDRFVELLTKLRDFPDTMLDTVMLGAQPIESVREAHRLHAAHHLRFLRPRLARRPALPFRSIEDAIAEVERLRATGYVKAGKWSLEQASFHLSRTTPHQLKSLPAEPPPATKPQVIERFKHYADHNAPPPGATAPPGTEPPADVAADIVDYYLTGLRTVSAFTEPFVDLGERGPIPVALYKGFVRGHAAHHLSFLVPGKSR